MITRNKAIFCLSLLIPFGIMLLYVWMTAAELPMRDDIYIIKGGPIENFLKGTLDFSDLWRPSDGQRFLGYNLFLLASAAAAWLALHRTRTRPRLFEASLAELSKDRQHLTSGS